MNWTPPEIGHDIHIIDVVNRALGYAPLDPQDHLLELLRVKVDDTQYDAAQARKDPSKLIGVPQPVDIEALDSEAKKWAEEYTKAIDIYNALLTTVDDAMHERSNDNDVHVTNGAKDPSQARITKQSAYKWLIAAFGIEVSEWAPVQAAPSEADKEMKVSEREKLQIMLAVLTKLYAESRGNNFGSSKNPTVKAVAEALALAIEHEGAHRPGLSAQTIGVRLSDALKVLRQSK